MSGNGDTSYPMGYTHYERERLVQQSRLFGDFTRRFLLDTGLAKGMRVLDVGCGIGDVSLLYAELIGPKGEVIGVDREPEALEMARELARAAWVGHVDF